MKNKHIKIALLTSIICGACVNPIDIEGESENSSSDITESTTPITFKAHIQAPQSKILDTKFQSGDSLGLFGIIHGDKISSKDKYLNNIILTSGTNNDLFPERTIFFPEGKITLDFYAYHPYQSDALSKKGYETTIDIAVKKDQDKGNNSSLSDFVVARAENIACQKGDVTLNFEHKLVKVNLIFKPQGTCSMESVLTSNPKILAIGFKTQGTYNFETDVLETKEITEDINCFGEWKIQDKSLTGKYIIVMPQEISDQELIIDWQGRIYHCPLTKIKLENGKQCDININASEIANDVLGSMTGNITDWGDGGHQNTTTDQNQNAIHISSLSFSTSDIYHVYQKGRAVAEICKEYLMDENNIHSKAIVAYPVKNDKADLTQGTVLKILDESKNIHGGTVKWNLGTGDLEYSAGNSAPIETFYIDEESNIAINKPLNAQQVNIKSYTIRDMRNKHLEELPIVKVGIQYWMKEDLKVTKDSKGNDINSITSLGNGAGYYNFKEGTHLYYNGELLLSKKLAPEGWRITTKKDWDILKKYVKDNTALIKTGSWHGFSGKEPSLATNETGLNISPTGMYIHTNNGFEVLSYYNYAAYWMLKDDKKNLDENVITITSKDTMFGDGPNKSKSESYYRAFCIRCVKE